jgi:hypothetical protein
VGYRVTRSRKCPHTVVDYVAASDGVMWRAGAAAIREVVRSMRCATCRAQISLGTAKGDRTRDGALLAPKASARGAPAEDADAWPWDVTRPVADQYREQVEAAFRRHTAASAAARHAVLDVEVELVVGDEPELGVEVAIDLGPDVTVRPTCASCGGPATCIGRYPDHNEEDCPYEGCTQHQLQAACDDCCGHSGEDGSCEPIDLEREDEPAGGAAWSAYTTNATVRSADANRGEP